MESGKTLNIDYLASSVLFEKAMKKFQVKKIIYRTLFRGKGLEFEGYRSFDPDDDYSNIDWKASLRSGQKMVRKYKEERDVSVYFLVDCSRSMLFGSGRKLKAEFSGEVVCALASLVLNSGDKAGLLMYSRNEVRFLEASNKKNQLFLIHKFLSDADNYVGAFDIENCFDFLAKHLKGGSNSVVLVSDFIHIKKGFDKKFFKIQSKTDILGLMVRDKMDELLPDLNYTLVVQDPFSEKKMVVSSAIARKRFYINSLKQKDRIKSVFKSKGIDLLELKNEEDFVLPLSNFMKKRAEEIRI